VRNSYRLRLNRAAIDLLNYRSRDIKIGNSRSSVPTGKSKYAKFKNNILVGYQRRKVEVFYA